MLVAVTVLPAAAGGWLKAKKLTAESEHSWPGVTRWIMNATRTRARQAAWVAALLLGPALLTFALAPPIDYLPPVKRAAIDAFFNFPPGMGAEQIDREIVSAHAMFWYFVGAVYSVLWFVVYVTK